MANVPISQLPNGQDINSASAAAVITLNRCRIGSADAKDATFQTVSASAMFSGSITADTVITSAFRATLVSAETVFGNAGRFTTVSASTPINVNSGGTGISTVSAYSLICGGTTNTGAFQGVSTQGTSGQVLTSNGANALPSWQTVAGGGPLLTQTASADAFIAFDSTYITSTYKKYVIELINVRPATGGATLSLVVSTDNGSTYKTASSDYAQSGFRVTSQGSLTGVAVGSAASIAITNSNGISNSSSIGLVGEVEMYDPSSSVRKQFFIKAHYDTDGANTLQTNQTGASYIGSTTAINNIKFAMSSGNIAAGTFKLYGIS